MKPNYTKITISLSIALGLTGDDDMISILINQEEIRQVNKLELFKLTHMEDVREIDIERRTETRRWHERILSKERRES